MGFNWRRAVRAVGTGGLSEGFRAAGVDLNPGPNGNDPRAQGYESRSPDQFQWDPTTGMPIGINGIPGSEFGLQYQYRAQELTRQRQNALWGDAQGSIGQGIDLLQSYRPGGSAALASGLFGQRANLYAQQAATLEEPDLLSAYRENKEIQATREAKRARNLQTILGIAGGVANIAGMAAGAPGAGAGLAAAAGAAGSGMPQGQVPAGDVMGQPGSAGQFYGMGAPATAAATGAPQGAAAWQGFQMPPIQIPPTGGTAQAVQGGGGGRAPGQPAPAGGGGPRPPGGGAGGGGAMAGAMGGGTGYGQDGMLTGPSLAASIMRSSPLMEPIAFGILAKDPHFYESTFMQVSSAATRLMAAV